MTRLAVLSDLHGNLPGLETVLADLRQFPVEAVAVAGDLINWGPFSEQVLDRVAELGWVVIRGNNEYYLLDYETPRAPAAWNDRRQYPMLPWLSGQLNRRWRAAIAAWPDGLSLRFPDAPPLRMAHGSPRSPVESLFPDSPEHEIQTALAGVEDDTIVTGHTHLAMDRRVGRWHLLNPGSAGVPLEGEHTLSYMLLDGQPDGWTATLRRLPFDPAPVLAELERQGFAEAFGPIGQLVVEEFRHARLAVYPFLAWRRQTCPDEPVRPELLKRFRQVDPWDYMPPAYQHRRPARRASG